MAFAVLLTAAVMIAQPVSAQELVVPDEEGDVGFLWDNDTGGVKDVGWVNSPVTRVGYFDMVSYRLSEVDNTYTFSMELAAELPEEGTAFSYGVRSAEWIIYIDAEPWNPMLNPVPSLFKVAATYDGTTYGGYLLDYESPDEPEELECSHDGAEISFSFPVDRIGDLAEGEVRFWWTPTVIVYWGTPDSYGFHLVDFPDWGVDWVSTPGQVWYGIPWPPG